MPIPSLRVAIAFLAPLAALGVLAPIEACGSSSSGGGSPAPDGSTQGDATNGVDASGSETGNPGSDSASAEGSADSGASETGSEAGPLCTRTLAAPDRARFVVVSHPYADDGGTATTYEVLNLSQTGTLTRPSTPVTFSMGLATGQGGQSSPIVFTPDGQVGIVAQDDGTIGVFTLDANGVPTVVSAAYQGAFYGGVAVVSADGAHVYILDSDTAPNHGGVYELTIGCDGTLLAENLAIPGGTAYVMSLLPTNPNQALLSAGAAFNSPSTADTELVDLTGLSLLASTEAFFQDADLFPIPSSVAVSADGKYALVADDGESVGNRIAVVSISSSALSLVNVLTTNSPAAVVTSPFNNAAIVLNAIGGPDQINVMSYNPAKPAAPFAITGELAYKFGTPQLPVAASLISQGSLKGMVFVAENDGVRQVTFGSDGKVTDTAKLVFPGTDLGAVVGTLGVQP